MHKHKSAVFPFHFENLILTISVLNQSDVQIVFQRSVSQKMTIKNYEIVRSLSHSVFFMSRLKSFQLPSCRKGYLQVVQWR